MRGAYKVQVSSKKLKYELDIERNITIIKGNSGTGKTTLINMIMYSRRNDSPYKVICDVECYAFSTINFDENVDLNRYNNNILFFDEDIDFVRTKEFAHIVKNSSCYFVIVSRESLATLPYSCKAVYKLEGEKLTSEREIMKNDMHALYDLKEKSVLDLRGILSLIVTEDKNAGFEFFEYVSGRMGIKCVSAEGNSKVLNKIKEELNKNEDTGILVIVDGAAFGAYYEPLRAEIKRFYNSLLYMPESFEIILLGAELWGEKTEEIADILEYPQNYIDSEKFFSWERYFTWLISEVTKGTEFQYSKNKLNKNYKNVEIARKILKNISAETGVKV